MIIGISGKRYAGKDTIANLLVEEFGFVSLAPGDIIRRVLHEMVGWSIEEQEARETKDAVCPVWGVSRRTAAQEVGRRMRDIFGQDLWVKRTFQILEENPDKHFVIPSIRSQIEVDEIRSRGGEAWLVVRPGRTEDEFDQHEIEAFAQNAKPEDFDFVVQNGADISALAVSIRAAMSDRLSPL